MNKIFANVAAVIAIASPNFSTGQTVEDFHISTCEMLKAIAGRAVLERYRDHEVQESISNIAAIIESNVESPEMQEVYNGAVREIVIDAYKLPWMSQPESRKSQAQAYSADVQADCLRAMSKL